MSRRFGLMGHGAGTRVVALLLVFGLGAGLGVPYLTQAGVPMWGILLLAALVIAIPVTLVARSERY